MPDSMFNTGNAAMQVLALLKKEATRKQIVLAALLLKTYNF